VQSSSQIITTNKPTSSFLQAGCPSCRPTNSAKSLKGKYHIPWTCHTHRWQTNAQLSAAEKPHRIPDILLHISMHRDADFSNFLSLSNASIVLKYRVVFQTSRYFMSSNFSTAWQGYHSGLSTLHSYRTVTGVSK